MPELTSYAPVTATRGPHADPGELALPGHRRAPVGRRDDARPCGTSAGPSAAPPDESEPAEETMPRAEAVPVAADGSASPSAGEPEAGSDASGEGSQTSETPATASATSDATTSPERRRTRRVSRPKPGTAAPPPPDFKDDVYED